MLELTLPQKALLCSVPLKLLTIGRWWRCGRVLAYRYSGPQFDYRCQTRVFPALVSLDRWTSGDCVPLFSPFHQPAKMIEYPSGSFHGASPFQSFGFSTRKHSTQTSVIKSINFNSSPNWLVLSMKPQTASCPRRQITAGRPQKSVLAEASVTVATHLHPTSLEESETEM